MGPWVQDISAVKERDPACRSTLEAVLCYPGVHAVMAHRLAHRLYKARLHLLARLLSQCARFVTGIEIHPGAVIGEGLFIDHGMGVVVGETAVLGRNVTLYQGVTLGGTGKERGKRHPSVGDGAMIATGAKVLGNITVGERSKIGAGAVVVRSVPSDATVVGVPGHAVRRFGKRVEGADLDHGDLPDPVDESVRALMARLEALEAELGKLKRQRPASTAKNDEDDS